MALLTSLVQWIRDKIDTLFAFFGNYSTKYSELLVYGLLIFLVGKMMKVKLNINTGSTKK